MSLLDHLLRVKNLDAYSRPKQKRILGQLALAYYLRKGAVPGWVVTLQKLAAIAPPDFKFNPWHDSLGRFTSGPSSNVQPVGDTTGGNQAPKSWGNPKTFQDHFGRHGGDFNAQSPENYANQANQFYQKVQNGEFPAVQDRTGVIRAYDPKTNTFGSYNSDGTTRTFFKPTNGSAYFQEQVSKDLSSGGRMINPLSESGVNIGNESPVEGGGGGGFGGGGGLDILHPHSPIHNDPWEIEE